jgi:uncharacterized membrane protein
MRIFEKVRSRSMKTAVCLVIAVLQQVWFSYGAGCSNPFIPPDNLHQIDLNYNPRSCYFN